MVLCVIIEVILILGYIGISIFLMLYNYFKNRKLNKVDTTNNHGTKPESQVSDIKKSNSLYVLIWKRDYETKSTKEKEESISVPFQQQ